jgi:hypothetical protein
MKKILATLALVLLPLSSGGASPGDRHLFAQQTAGAVYYVDINHPQADDANPGTQSQPWQHCPGMPGWTGSATLEAGDTVYFNSGGTWETSSGSALLQVIGGVTYDGSSWGCGTRATLRASAGLHRSVINLMEDHPSEPTVVRGFEVDANQQETSGIAINWPQAQGSMTGATKRIEDCVVHDTYSRSADGSYEYGIVISSGWGGNLHVSNVEVLDCEVYNISRGGVNVYAANDYANSSISNVLVRGCEIYATGQDPSYAGSALAAKNHIVNAVFEYNTIRDPERGPGLGISTHTAGFTGPEGLVIRYNIVTNSPHTGIYIQSPGNKSIEIYGNLIANSTYDGLTFAGSLADSLSARVYNNTFYQNYEPEWGSEIRVHATGATISTLEVRNNIIYSDSNSRCLIDDAGSITNHSNNVYYRPGGGTLVIANGNSYTASDVASWEPTALGDDPLLENPSAPPSGFIGTLGIDIKPDSDGLSLTADSPARDAGATLDVAYASSINSVTRPSGAGWDIGAYELEPLALHGAPGNQIIYLDWRINITLPASATWRITTYSQTITSTLTATVPLSTTRAYTLTNLTNYTWYTVTLNAMAGTTPILTDTVRVMPTDQPATITTHSIRFAGSALPWIGVLAIGVAFGLRLLWRRRYG